MRTPLLLTALTTLLLAACSRSIAEPSAVATPTSTATRAATATVIPEPTRVPEHTPTPATATPLPADTDASVLRLQALAAVASGDTAAALRDADAAVELAPANLATHDARAYVRLIAGQYEQAYAEYTFVIDQGDAPAITFLGAGLAASALGDTAAMHTLLRDGLTGARADADSPWDTDPQHRFLVTSASATLMAQHAPAVADSIRSARLDDALELLDEIETWAWAKDLAFVHEQKAAIHASRGDYESAIDRLARAIEAEATSRRYASLGQALFYAGMHLDALRAYSTAITLDPDNAQLYEDRAFINGRVDQWERALADLDHAIGLAPDNPSLHALRGEAHYNLGGFEAAIADFRRTLDLEPAEADAALARERLAELAPGP